MYFFIVKKPNNYSIIYSKDKLNLNTELYNKYNKQVFDIKKLANTNSYVKKITTNYQCLFDTLNMIFNKYDIDKKDIGCLRSDMTNNTLSFYINDIDEHTICKNIDNCNKKFKFLLQNMISFVMYDKIKNLNYCDREEFIYNYKLTYISYFFDILETGGSVLIGVFNYCDPNTINIIYLLSILFDKVILYDGIYIYCKDFLYLNSGLTKDIILGLKNKSFTITNKTDIKDLIKYINKKLEDIININKKLLSGDIDSYIDNKINKFFLQIDEAKIYPNQFCNDVLKKLKINIIKDYRRIIINSKIKKIHSGIKSPEMESIVNLISNNNLVNCLEIGMAFGISTISILSNKKCNLISIDPFQSTQWESNGVKLIKELGYEDRHTLIEKKSNVALPELLNKKDLIFDFIFIDGWHTFDYTLVDFFYSNLLLKIGGFIMIDDALHNGVSSCMRYLNSNYIFYKKMESIESIGVYKKIKEDNRDWNFHVNF
jgi:predicted O-methyltransferase YrrM